MCKLYNKGDFKHISNYISSNASADIQLLGIWPVSGTTKEVSETMGMVEAVREHGFNEDSMCLVVGDGRKPRTGVCLAFFTDNYKIISVDPDMIFEPKFEIRNFKFVKDKIENVSVDCEGKPLLIVHPHSHAEIARSVSSVYNYSKIAVISMPCCVPDKCDFEKVYSYRDSAIFSPHNLINVYVSY